MNVLLFNINLVSATYKALFTLYNFSYFLTIPFEPLLAGIIDNIFFFHISLL
jgi:hypothetical protein